MPVDEALERIRALRHSEHGLLAAAWSSVDDRAPARHERGSRTCPRALRVDARQVYVDAGLRMTAATFAQGGAEIAFRAGDLDGEEALLRDSLEILEGDRRAGFLFHPGSHARRVPLPRRSG